MTNRLEGKWALVTGASSGFGAETARQFAGMGVNLLLGARREDRLAKVAAECAERGAASVHVHKLDVTCTESVNGFSDWAKSTAGRVDVLVNNAGGAHGVDRVEDGKDADWETMFQSNALGILRVTRAILPLMKPHSGGVILNIGSIAGRVAYEGGSAYCASKAAELSITKALRLELNGTGLRVGTIDPGMAETEFSMVRLKGDREKADAVYSGVEPLTAVQRALPEHLRWAPARAREGYSFAMMGQKSSEGRGWLSCSRPNVGRLAGWRERPIVVGHDFFHLESVRQARARCAQE